MDYIKMLEQEQMKNDIPDFRPGDTVRVAVERCFPVHSPRVDKITVVRQGRVRRAKLYYMRERFGKAARIKEVRR